MIHFASLIWPSILAIAAAMPTGTLATTLGLMFVGFVIYLSFRERYLIFWLVAWGFFLLSRAAPNSTILGGGGGASLVFTNISFVLALTFFAVSALHYTDALRHLPWVGALCFFGLAAAVTQAFYPSSMPLSLCYQLTYHAIAVLAAVRLILFAIGRFEIGPWLFAITLLLLRSDTQSAGGAVASAYQQSSEMLLQISILLVVLDESRARSRQLDVMYAITSVAVGARDYGAMMLTAMNELCRLYGAKYSWFQLVEGDDLVLKQHVGLPGWVTQTRRRVPLRGSVIKPLLTGLRTTRISVRSLAPELRRDLERAGMRYLVLVPVRGKTDLLGILAFGLTGRRSFTAEQLGFLSSTAKQLGMAGENLRMFEQVLQTQRQWLSTIDAIDDYILVHDAEPRVLRLNRALARRLGRAETEVTGEPLASILPNAQNGCPYCRLAKQTSGEISDPCFGGYSLISTSSYVEDRGETVGTVHIICDRTEQRIGEERYRLLFESVQEGVFVSTPDGQLLDCNPAFAAMLGYQGRTELLSINLGSALFLSPEQRHAYTEMMNTQGYLRNYEISLRRKDGSVATLMENSFAARDAQGKSERYQGFLQDITEKKQVEEDMQRHNRELRALNAMATVATQTFDLDEILQNTLHWTTELFSQHCGIVLIDPESGAVTRTETSLENREEARDLLRRLMDKELTEFVRLEQNEIITEEEMPRLPLTSQSWITAHGYQSFVAVAMYSQRKIMGVLLISSPNKNQFTESDRDLAIAIARQLGNCVEKVLLYEETAHAYENLRNAQEQLLQSEKMSAIGQLVAGVAHELNNPLTAILGYAQLLESEPIGERALDFVHKLFKQTQRTHRVVQNLLAFSRQRKPVKSQVDLRRVLEDTLALREFDLKLNNVIVKRDYDPSAPFITGDAHQLEQVFLNIINNAVDSIMDSAHGGSLGVRIYPEDNRACVEFRDSGPGLKDPTKIFDPFYTTKKIGKGTGLGLSICYGIVKEHGGDIIAGNHEQGGAVFLLKLPIKGPRQNSLS